MDVVTDKEGHLKWEGKNRGLEAVPPQWEWGSRGKALRGASPPEIDQYDNMR